MTPTVLLLVLITGVAIGVAGGVVGIGGGILVIPVLMSGFGFSQARANGTSLAMLLPPIGIFAVLAYARAGNVDWGYAGLLAVGFAVGAYGGAKLVSAGAINPTMLRVAFAALLLFVAGRLLFRTGGVARAALETSLLVGVPLALYAVMRLLGRRWSVPSGGAIYRARRGDPVGHDAEFDYDI